MTAHRAPARCRRNGCTADPGTPCSQCPVALAAEPLLRPSHKRRPRGPSERPPAGAGSVEEPGSLWDSYEEASKQ